MYSASNLIVCDSQSKWLLNLIDKRIKYILENNVFPNYKQNRNNIEKSNCLLIVMNPLAFNLSTGNRLDFSEWLHGF